MGFQMPDALSGGSGEVSPDEDGARNVFETWGGWTIFLIILSAAAMAKGRLFAAADINEEQAQNGGGVSLSVN